jgi:hypothetical protein
LRPTRCDAGLTMNTGSAEIHHSVILPYRVFQDH